VSPELPGAAWPEQPTATGLSGAALSTTAAPSACSKIFASVGFFQVRKRSSALSSTCTHLQPNTNSNKRYHTQPSPPTTTHPHITHPQHKPANPPAATVLAHTAQHALSKNPP
jgi:hypothetical protein